MSDTKINTANDQLIGAQGDYLVVNFPRQHMTKVEALRHAAWLVAMAEERPGEFDEVLAAVKNI